MKIGIIALELRYNFGGIFQAYALQKVLRNLGHDVIHVDKIMEVSLGPWYKKYPIYIKRSICKYILGKNIIIKADIEQNRISNAIAKNTDLFIGKYIRKIRIKDFSNFKEEDFDVIIVGSDQVWRPKYFFSKIENAYLDFAKEWKIKRIAYAASFGTEEWEYTEKQTNNCATLLKKFNAVSVRESSAVKLCYDNFGVKAEHVLDPTMLLLKEDYIKLFKDYNATQSDGNLFCYILDEGEEKKSIIDCVAKEKGLKTFYVNSRYDDHNAPLKERIQQPVEKWLRAFYDAEFVITDSFHACVFSIIFNKPFIVYGNKERGLARFNSLLSIFGLEERIVSTKEEATKAISKPINWEKVNESHRQWKEKSVSFLNNNLKQQQ